MGKLSNTPKKPVSKSYTFGEVAPFFNSLMHRKVINDAKMGLDPQTNSSLESFTFQEFIALGQNDVLAGKQLMNDYFDTVCKEIMGPAYMAAANPKKLKTMMSMDPSKMIPQNPEDLPNLKIHPFA